MFIRTKDGRILDLDRIKRCAESYSFNNESETHLSVEWDIIREEIDIIKQADTIEELCDEFVVCATNTSKNITYHHTYSIDMLKEYIDRVYPLEHTATYITFHFIKVAIWTDKGLIYVAKMNNEGELELL